MTHKKEIIKEKKAQYWESYEYDRQLEMKHALTPYLESLRSSELKVLFYIINSGHTYFYCAHDTIAKKIGLSRRTVLTALATIHRLGLVSKKYRHRQSTMYRLVPLFSFDWVKEQLRNLFNGITLFSLALLVNTACARSIHRDCVPPVIKKNEILKKSITVVERRGKKMSHQIPIPISEKKEAPETPYRHILDLDREIRSCRVALEERNFPRIFANEMVSIMKNRIDCLEHELHVAMSKLAVFENSFVKGS